MCHKTTTHLWQKNLVGFGPIRSDLVGLGQIWSDLVIGKFGRILVGFGWILSESVGISRIWSEPVGFGQNQSDLVGVAPAQGT